jgi:hypothetical protein
MITYTERNLTRHTVTTYETREPTPFGRD